MGAVIARLAIANSVARAMLLDGRLLIAVGISGERGTVRGTVILTGVGLLTAIDGRQSRRGAPRSLFVVDSIILLVVVGRQAGNPDRRPLFVVLFFWF